MDTILIDAKKAFKRWHLQQFEENQTDDVNVVMYIEPTQVIFERPLKDMRKFFEDEEVEKNVPDDNCVISFITETKVLQILGIDFNWWIAVVRNKKYRRLDRLFSKEKIEEQQTQETSERQKKEKNIVVDEMIYKCACGIKKDNEVVDIEKFEGTKKDMICFVNRLFQKNQIRSMFKAVVVFCINYKFDSDLNDINNWFTLNELYDKGVFVK